MGNAGADELARQINAKEAEAVRIRQAIASLEKVESEIHILKQALAIVRGEEPETASITNETRTAFEKIVRSRRKLNIPDLGYEVLKSKNAPMSSDDLVAAIQQKGCESSRQTILGGLYRAAKKKDRIVLLGSGTFGLIEWEKRKDDVAAERPATDQESSGALAFQ